MTIGASLFLIALGAILTFATDWDVSGLDIDTAGVILMLVGIIGLVLDLMIWGPRRRRPGPTDVVDEDHRTYHDETTPL